jgi:hypothetical protein
MEQGDKTQIEITKLTNNKERQYLNKEKLKI